MKKILENFLPIPDAPQYEINSQLICRNVKTKYVLKLFTGRHNSPYYSLHMKDKCLQRSPKFFRRRAEAAACESTFMPIPSLDNRYEINRLGKVRNAVSKKLVKPKLNGKCYCFQIDYKYISRAVADLLWEVHGIIRKRRFRPCRCRAEKFRAKYSFESMKDCARFLAPKVFYSVGWLQQRLYRRDREIFGWKITYLDE